jgi:23S rRNA U2552 (ribose-2'-O)-methylase RlmE/FtsJ/DNA-directed RNA polymerase subunit E'/Rpb7
MTSNKNLYIKQFANVKILLKPREINKEWNNTIEYKIKSLYGNKCYMGGYLLGSSIEICSISQGKVEGSQSRGDFTFHVIFSGLYLIPHKGDIIRCKITDISNFGYLADELPLKIVIPKGVQLKYNPEIKNISINSYVLVKVLSKLIVDNKLNVCGYIDSLNIDTPNKFILPTYDNVNYNIKIIIDDNKPIKMENKMHENVLNAENRITDPNVWKNHIRKLINPYEYLNESFKSKCKNITSRAFYKIWEMLHDYPELLKNNKMKIGCLAEAPGGFISGIYNYRMKIINNDDEYYAISLIDKTNKNINDFSGEMSKKLFEMVKINIDEKDKSGNLTDTNVIKNFINFVGKNSCDLITADGGIDKAENDLYEYEEIANSKLFFGEILTALGLQSKGGSFIIKIYDIYYHMTIQLIIILQYYYETVNIVKPLTSRPANSEKYLVCTGYKKAISEKEFDNLIKLLDKWNEIENKPLTDYKNNSQYFIRIIDTIDDDQSEFMTQLKNFNDITSREQLNTLLNGLNLIDTFTTEADKIIVNQKSLALEWCKKYELDL